jgi:hypothetical protein
MTLRRGICASATKIAGIGMLDAILQLWVKDKEGGGT